MIKTHIWTQNSLLSVASKLVCHLSWTGLHDMACSVPYIVSRIQCYMCLFNFDPHQLCCNHWAATKEVVQQYMTCHKDHPIHTNVNGTLTIIEAFRVSIYHHHKQCIVLLVVGTNVFIFDLVMPNCTKTITTTFSHHNINMKTWVQKANETTWVAKLT